MNATRECEHEMRNGLELEATTYPIPMPTRQSPHNIMTMRHPLPDLCLLCTYRNPVWTSKVEEVDKRMFTWLISVCANKGKLIQRIQVRAVGRAY